MHHRSTRERWEQRGVGARLRSLIAVFAGVALTLTAPLPVFAADATDSAVTWSVQPADASAPDGRSWVEQTIDPGDTAVEHLAVHNFSDREVTFRLVAADGVFNQNGRFNILPSDQKSTAAGTWIEIPDSVTVPAGATAVVPFSTTVPIDAEPGDHAAGVAASVMTTTTEESGATVGVDSRVGFRVMTRVAGDLTPSAEVIGFTSSYRTAWNPFAPGMLTVDFDVKNTGNARLRVGGAVEVGGQSVRFPFESEPRELLSGDTQHFTVEIPDVWPLFALPVDLTVDPIVVVVSGDAPQLDVVEVNAIAAVIPWSQAIVLLGLALVIFAFLRGRVRSRRKVAALVEDARQQGRLEALERQTSS